MSKPLMMPKPRHRDRRGAAATEALKRALTSSVAGGAAPARRRAPAVGPYSAAVRQERRLRGRIASEGAFALVAVLFVVWMLLVVGLSLAL